MKSQERLDDLSDKELYSLWMQCRGEQSERVNVSRSRQAGGALVKRYIGDLQRFLRKRLGDDCQDVLSETTKAMLYGNYRGEGSFRNYVFGIAYRQTFKVWRTRSRQKQFDPSVSSLNDLGGSITYIMDKRQVRALVAVALRRIPVENQQALELYFIEGHTGPEATEIIGISLPAFRGRLRRGLEKLRREIAELESTGKEYEAGLSAIEDWAAQLEDDGESDDDESDNDESDDDDKVH